MQFQMWSFYHFFLIFLPIVGAIALAFLLRKCSMKTKRLAGVILSAIAVALLIARNIEIFLNNGHRLDPDLIPLQICHFANFVLLFAFLLDNKLLFSLSFCLNLPAALMSLIFANSLENYVSIWTVRGIAYQFGHVLIVLLGLYAVLTELVQIDFKLLIRTLILMCCIYLISLPVNSLFNHWMPEFTSNYFYSIEPEAGTPLEIFFDISKEVQFLGMKFRPLYLLLTGLLGIAVVSVFFGLYQLIHRFLLHAPEKKA